MALLISVLVTLPSVIMAADMACGVPSQCCAENHRHCCPGYVCDIYNKCRLA